MNQIENKVMQSFASSFKGDFSEFKFQILEKEYFTFSALEFLPDDDFDCGFGASFERQSAAVKAIAEFYERKVSRLFFADVNKNLDKHLSHAYCFKAFQTTNGWAVHQTGEQAKSAAYLEALERHILLCTYIQSGWDGFTLIDQKETSDVIFYSLVSKYSCNGYKAGIAIAKSKKLAGVTFGYLCEKENEILNSPKWEHAMFEALGQIEMHLKIENKDSLKQQGALEEMAQWYLSNDWVEPKFSSELRSIKLNEVNPSYYEEDLNESCGVPLMASYCYGGGLIPLFFPSNLNKKSKKFVTDFLLANGLNQTIPERHPVL